MLNVEHPLYQEDLYRATFLIRKHMEHEEHMRVLIIGATGLIGSFLADTLIYYNRKFGKKFEIYAMSRSMLRLKHRFSYVAEDEIFLWEHDINDEMDVELHFDYVFHLASNADPETYKAYPLETITGNVQGTINVLKYAKKHLSSKILFTSTMEVYGESEGKELFENDYGVLDFNKIRNGYPESKRVAELMYRSAAAEYGVQGYIARLGYVYGATMTEDDSKVVAQFIRMAMNGNDVVMKSAGLQQRTYCYVADAVTGMLLILLKGIPGNVYNIADKESKITIKKLGEIVAQQSAVSFVIQNPEIINNNNFRDDKVLNTDKIELLGWRAQVNIEEGISRIIEILR